MKKIVGSVLYALIFFCVLSVQVSAQINFGVKGGVNISSIHLSEEIVSSGNITGFHVGPMVEIMAPYTGLGVDVAILYSQKGTDINSKSLTTDYIDVPVNFKWKFGAPLVERIIKGYLAVGPYAGFRVGGDKIWDIPNTINSQIETKAFSAGINMGIGAELFRHVQVGFTYGLGLTNNYTVVDGVETTEGKQRGWSISAAVLF